MLKITHQFPPNYQMIVAKLGDLSSAKPIFCYGDTLYNPFKREVTPDVHQHELIHSRQQKGYSTPEEWYNLYLNNPAFRLSQETEAYCEQYKFAKEHGISGKFLEWVREKIAFELSGEAYGRLISFGEAESKLRHYVK